VAENSGMTGDVYFPAPEVVERAHIKNYEEVHKAATADLAGFWGKVAAENYEWYKPWETVLDDSNAPFYKWFVNAKVNIIHNALDRHMRTATRNKAALIFEGEKGDSRVYTYQQLNHEVCKFASVLRSMGIGKGDRVTIYMGRIPELMIAMLACAKIGAMHSVVYGGFSTEALLGRIDDSRSKLLITCDGAWLRGDIIELKKIANEAVDRAGTIQSVICVKRTGHDVEMVHGRDYWYHDLMSLPVADAAAKTEVMDAEDPLFILYTSGTTGKPKAILHTHGGYMVWTSTTLKWVFDIKPRGRLVVCRRSGLDYRPQLHRVRPADFGFNQLHVRRCTNTSVSGSLVVAGGQVPRHHFIHGPYCDSRPDALWGKLARQARSFQPAPAWLRR
jgi:acetyl-CoA synthetase